MANHCWHEALDRYLQGLRQRGYSSNTLEIYRRWLTTFFGTCLRQGLQRLEELTPEHVAAFRRELLWTTAGNGRLFSPSSVYQGLQSTRTFVRWLVREGLLLVDPTQDLVLRRPPHPKRRLLRVDEVSGLLEGCDTTTPIGLRNRAVVETLYATGIRRAECLGLNLTDVDPVGKRLRVMGKGRRERFLPTGERLAESLDRYLRQSRPHLADLGEPALFVTRHGGRLGTGSLAQLVQGLADDLGLGRLSPHLLRHACASHLVENGADVRHIQELLGHRFLKTTAVYCNLAPRALFREHERTHPRGGRRKGRVGPAGS
ncbi:MAG: tyrosine-type recombinase/integrase [Chloroflexi bacterium]|nr:tyrosine-type recombinase/integrase [Chloroflexota bacterium]